MFWERQMEARNAQIFLEANGKKIFRIKLQGNLSVACFNTRELVETERKFMHSQN